MLYNLKIVLSCDRNLTGLLVNVACVFLHSDAARFASTERPPKLGKDRFRKCD